MIDSSKWTEKDMLQLISNAEQESIELEYKSCGSLENTEGKKKEISKDVSALANSAGGTIVYGIIEKGHVPEKLDNGFDPHETSKEWLEQVISSRIQRKIDGFHINSVSLTTTNPGRVAYVVTVPQSTRAPHQASDKRFYKRHNFQSVPMEEYEIRDVSHRSSGPILSISFRLEDDSVVKVEKARSVRRVKIMPLITNESPAPAEYITINIYVDRDVFKLHGNHELKKMPEEKEFFVDENTKQCHRLHMNHTIQKGIPIFEGSPFRLLNDPITIDIDHDGDYFMAYTLLAPYMSEVFGAAVLQVSREGAVIQGFTSATE